MNQMSEFTYTPDKTEKRHLDLVQRISLLISGFGILMLFVQWEEALKISNSIGLTSSLTAIIAGGLIYAIRSYAHKISGIQNNGVWFDSLTNRGAWGWFSAIILTGFYIILYFYPQYLGLSDSGEQNGGIIRLFDPLSLSLNGNPASQWFVYGTLYTLAILVMGIKFIFKYRNNTYQIVRTVSVMFFQLGFAFLIPEILESLNSGQAYYGKDLKNMWPLNFYFFYDWNLNAMIEGGTLGLFFILWGLALVVIISPVLTYFFGKRWYCSWVCGCGGLAETAGDPFRHLSDKSMRAWKIERWMIHVVLALVTLVTIAMLFSFFKSDNEGKLWISTEIFTAITGIALLLIAGLIYWKRQAVQASMGPKIFKTSYIILGILLFSLIINYASGSYNAFFINSYSLQSWYGFFIGSIFSGVIGVGFYPIMGSRVWCRFGCPMAAILGLQQKFLSRFRITTNGGQCISCGNCSTYCEMGIDVRAYAQKGQNIVRASCVGCGICAAVCPRGVLRLENGKLDIDERTSQLRTIHIAEEQVGIL